MAAGRETLSREWPDQSKKDVFFISIHVFYNCVSVSFLSAVWYSIGFSPGILRREKPILREGYSGMSICSSKGKVGSFWMKRYPALMKSKDNERYFVVFFLETVRTVIFAVASAGGALSTRGSTSRLCQGGCR